MRLKALTWFAKLEGAGLAISAGVALGRLDGNEAPQESLAQDQASVNAGQHGNDTAGGGDG